MNALTVCREVPECRLEFRSDLSNDASAQLKVNQVNTIRVHTVR